MLTGLDDDSKRLFVVGRTKSKVKKSNTEIRCVPKRFLKKKMCPGLSFMGRFRAPGKNLLYFGDNWFLLWVRACSETTTSGCGMGTIGFSVFLRGRWSCRDGPRNLLTVRKLTDYLNRRQIGHIWAVGSRQKSSRTYALLLNSQSRRIYLKALTVVVRPAVKMPQANIYNIIISR